jgi:hypothetical protein
MPFVFSAEQAYVLEAGDAYMRVFRDRGQVMSGASAYEITTPYAGTSIGLAKHTQNADTMYITHPNYRPQKLVRSGHASWTMTGVSTTHGPAMNTPALPPTLTATSGGAGGVSFPYDTTHVKATSNFGVDYREWFACNSTLSLTGVAAGNAWQSGATGASHQCFHIDIGGASIINRIYYENYHSAGAGTNVGAKHFLIFAGASSGAFANTDWYADAGWVQLGTDETTFAEHVAVDQPDPQYITVYNNTAYQYYRIKFIDNWGGALYIGVRRITLQENASVTINAAGATVFYPEHVGSVWRWDMSGGSSGYFTITAYDSGTSVAALVGSPLSPLYTYTWGEAAWSDYRGWPYAVKFHEDRLIYGGSNHMPTTIWGSRTGQYDDFYTGETDQDAFALTTQNLSAIRWLESVNVLLVGTTGGVLKVGANVADNPLTYEAICKTQSRRGCADIMPEIVGEAILYIHKSNRKVRELVYSLERDGYVAPDRTIVSEHITKTGVSAIAYQQEPDSVLWCLLKNGTLASFTYEPDEKILAWTKHETDGFIESICIIPGVEEDELWASIIRSVGGVSVHYIEYMTPQGFNDICDCFYVDSGLSRTGAGTTTMDITGLDHLAGCSVAILVDGVPHDDMRVSALGGVSLTFAGTTIHAGLPYSSTFRSVNLEGGSRMGTAIGKTKRVIEVLMRFYNTVGGKMGFDDNTLHLIPYPSWKGSATALYSGDTKSLFMHGYDTEAYVEIVQDKPLPMTILNVIPVFDVKEKQ